MCNAAELITTDGYGEVRVPPDSLRVTVGVEAQAATLADARNEVNTKMQSVIQALNGLQIQGMSLQTQILQFYPIYGEKVGDQPAPIIGYHASNGVTATVLGSRPAELGGQASSIVDAALGAGANTVGDLQLFLNDPREARGNALALAIEDARSDAEALADAAGVTLAGLCSVDESPGSRSFGRSADVAALSEAPATPVETGEIVVSSSVTARYRFTE